MVHYAKPSSNFVTSVSVDDIRQAAAAEEAAAHEALVKAQIKEAKKQARLHGEELKAMWRGGKQPQRQLHGKENDQTFRGWLQRTGKGADYVPLDPKDVRWAIPGDPRGEINSSLYGIDVTGRALNEQLRRQINRSARPLRDIDLRSDAWVEFLGH
ncbi:hypothetical protein MRS44_013821 [Fusarium solani]|uniref:uncharacterized protein n=1 Tax=Fusarium solani TaxID=169388 RepID=UPI0032C3F560|nr:hypothetical protein MRS44_013821 [Fusarium solani]